MAEGIVYKPQTGKGPVILLAKEPKSPPTMTLKDGTVVTAVRGDKKGGSYYNEGHYQYVFPNEVLGQADAQLSVDGETTKISNSNKSYRGDFLNNLKESDKGAIGDTSGNDVSNGPLGTTQIGQFGVAPENQLKYFPDAEKANFFGITGVNYKETSVKQFASDYAGFNTNLFKQNSSTGKDIALDQLDTELQGLKKFVPEAANLKRNEINSDNNFNQSQRTSQVNSTVPDVVSDINSIRSDAQTYAKGQLPDAQADRALELGIRSSQADVGASSGFGASSSANRKISDLMSARERFSIAQYGNSLEASNDDRASALLLAPTSYSNAGESVNVNPSVSAGQLQSAASQQLNASTLIDPTNALNTQISQQQFKTNLDFQVKSTNASNATNVDQFNVSNDNNFALSKFNYRVSYANSVAQALQNNINTNVSIDQQNAARDEFSKQKNNTQKANTINSLVSLGVGSGVAAVTSGLI